MGTMRKKVSVIWRNLKEKYKKVDELSRESLSGVPCCNSPARCHHKSTSIRAAKMRKERGTSVSRLERAQFCKKHGEASTNLQTPIFLSICGKAAQKRTSYFFHLILFLSMKSKMRIAKVIHGGTFH